MHRDTQVALLATRKKQIVAGLLDNLCQQIEITDRQYQTAKTRYEAIGSWLSESTSRYLHQVQIYPQGSIALGTTTKPLASNEFDVDLVCHLPIVLHTSDAHAVKALIGDRLKEHATYKGMLEEKQRCWRINYANEFHLDITPSVNNPNCYQGGELVPDKTMVHWKTTNPKGYTAKFEQYAAIKPHFHVPETIFGKAVCDSVEPMPEQTMSKPLLKRIVQLLKRHRDHMFVGTARADLAPISIIITTLAGWAYAKCATQQLHADAFDFITAVIREMPAFIRVENWSGKQHFIIANETTIGENFADKWNSDPRLVTAFTDWHSNVITSVQSLLMIEGVDRFADSLSRNFGAKTEDVRQTLAGISAQISHARSAGRLAIAPTLGLITSPALGSVMVPKNTFFGR
jgi:hypothetical protein